MVNFPPWKLNVFYQMASELFPALNFTSQKTGEGCRVQRHCAEVGCCLSKKALSLELCNWYLFQFLNVNLFGF